MLYIYEPIPCHSGVKRSYLCSRQPKITYLQQKNALMCVNPCAKNSVMDYGIIPPFPPYKPTAKAAGKIVVNYVVITLF